MAQPVMGQWWTGGNNGLSWTTNFLGTTDGVPINFRTDNLFRARINPRMTYSLLNSFPNIPADGFTLITPDNGFLGQPPRGPFSRLHLAEGGTTGNAEQWGYRPWQKNGITFTGNNDQGYIGQKYREGDAGYTDMVMQWSDNPEVAKSDRLRFIFTSAYHPGTPSGMNSREGMEGMRLWPTFYRGINVGIGDFFAGNLIDPTITDPTERLDVLDGRVRIRQLPTDPIAPSLTKFLVVDDTPGPDYGVVKWRNMPTGTGGGCEWTLLGAPGSNSDIATAYINNPGCPQADRKVGIGTNAPQYKLHVVQNSSLGSGGGLSVNYAAPQIGVSYGIVSDVQPQPGQGLDQPFAIQGSVSEVDNSGIAVYGIARANAHVDGTTNSIYGTSGLAYGPSNGSVLLEAYGAKGEVISGTAGTITTAYGVYGKSTTLDHHTGANYGVYGFSKYGTTNYGIFGVAGDDDAATVCYGVYGNFGGPDDPSGLNGHTKWAGYFPGNTYVGGTVFGPSDVQLKQNIADLPVDTAVSKLLQLVPKTYDFNQDQFGFMHLPTEHQYGLIAQDVEAVLPTLVTNIHQPAMQDSAGGVMNPEVDFMAMNYQGLIPLLVAGFQAQQQQIAALQAQVAQCCASNPGMAPEGSGGLKSTPATGELREQRLLIIPNPVADLTTLEYYVPKAGMVVLQVASMDGKPLATLREEMAEPGAYQYTWNTSKLAPGTYLCTYMLEGAVVVQKAVKVAR